MDFIMDNDVLNELTANEEDVKKYTSYTKDAAVLFANLVYPAVISRLNDVSSEKSFNVTLEYNNFDLIVYNDKNQITTIKIDDPALFNTAIPEVEVEIKVSWSQDNDLFDVDGWLMTVDDEDLKHEGLVYIEADLPADPVLAKKSVKALRQEIVAVLVHEFRHAIQRLWGWSLNTCDDINEHMTSPAEIDARVEEICSYSPKNMDKITAEEFESLAGKYFSRYLLRNAASLMIEEFNLEKKRLVERHSAYFLKRKDVDEFTPVLKNISK